MEIRGVALRANGEVRNDGGAWLPCDIEGAPSFNDGDVVTFHPSVVAVMARVVPQIFSLGEHRNVAGRPFLITRSGPQGDASLWIHNSNGGVTRLGAGYLFGHLHITRSEKKAMQEAQTQKADVQAQLKRKAS